MILKQELTGTATANKLNFKSYQSYTNKSDRFIELVYQ